MLTLIVTTKKPSRHVRKTNNLALDCNGLALSYVYADLSQKWKLNGNVWKNYGITTLEAVSINPVRLELFDKR